MEGKCYLKIVIDLYEFNEYCVFIGIVLYIFYDVCLIYVSFLD